jgi:isopentenyl diphosphate isomerase/L-lactate dehydrogenase-like FMN-dependent dehydrogenase
MDAVSRKADLKGRCPQRIAAIARRTSPLVQRRTVGTECRTYEETTEEDAIVTQTAGTEVTGDNEFQTLHEIVRAARANLDQNLWDYVTGGTETETTVRRNRQALDRIAFRPRVLRDVSSIDPASEFMGHHVRLPVILAPVGGLEAIGEGGGMTVAQGAGLAGVPFFLSSVTPLGMEAVAAAATGPKVFQLYVRGDGAWVDDHVRRAVDSGYDAFCLTVDSAIYSRRERDIANRFSKAWRGATPGMAFQAALNWDDISRFKAKHDVRLILKGIGTPEDAAIACQHGVDVVYVSNHGGRQLDHSLGALDILPEIVTAVAGHASIMIDGGFSRGTDIVKAIALGASAVGIGRLYCYGLAAAGAAGIARVIELLEVEIATCLGLLGLTSFAGLDASYVRAAEPVTDSGVHGAFPLLHAAASVRN